MIHFAAAPVKALFASVVQWGKDLYARKRLFTASEIENFIKLVDNSENICLFKIRDITIEKSNKNKVNDDRVST